MMFLGALAVATVFSNISLTITNHSQKGRCKASPFLYIAKDIRILGLGETAMSTISPNLWIGKSFD
jgi:hypothetical protein